LVIPTAHCEHPSVQYLLALLQDDEFKQTLGSQPGYDSRQTGTVQYRV